MFTNKSNLIVYFFPTSVCDICEKDIFLELKNNYSIMKQIIVLVPMSSFRDFKRFSKEYELEFDRVIAYRGQIINSQEQINRSLFFCLNENYKISNILLPKKPIKKGSIKKYYNNLFSKGENY